MVIYLFVNGQVLAKPVHLCHAMAAHNITSTLAADTLQIHQHPVVDEHHKVGTQVVDEIKTDSSMNNCQCVDCDCTANLISQANLTLVSVHELVAYFPIIQKITSKPVNAYASQSLSNLYRPPIFS